MTATFCCTRSRQFLARNVSARYSRLRPVSNENRLVGRLFGGSTWHSAAEPGISAFTERLGSWRNATPSVTMLLFWPAN
jgi:hypothetical protein